MTKKYKKMIQLWKARSGRETSRNGLTDPANLPRATRTRKLREKKKMSITLKTQYKTTPPSKNMRKVVIMTRRKTAMIMSSQIYKNRGRSFIKAQSRIVSIVFVGEIWRQQ